MIIEAFKNADFLRSCPQESQGTISPFIALDAIDFLSCRKETHYFSHDYILRKAVEFWHNSTSDIIPYLERISSDGGLYDPVVDENNLVIGSKLHYLPQARRLSVQQEEVLRTSVLISYHQGKVGKSIAALKLLLKLEVFDHAIDGIVSDFLARSYCCNPASRFRREATDCDHLRRRILDNSQGRILGGE